MSSFILRFDADAAWNPQNQLGQVIFEAVLQFFVKNSLAFFLYIPWDRIYQLMSKFPKKLQLVFQASWMRKLTAQCLFLRNPNQHPKWIFTTHSTFSDSQCEKNTQFQLNLVKSPFLLKTPFLKQNSKFQYSFAVINFKFANFVLLLLVKTHHFAQLFLMHSTQIFPLVQTREVQYNWLLSSRIKINTSAEKMHF